MKLAVPNLKTLTASHSPLKVLIGQSSWRLTVQKNPLPRASRKRCLYFVEKKNFGRNLNNFDLAKEVL